MPEPKPISEGASSPEDVGSEERRRVTSPDSPLTGTMTERIFRKVKKLLPFIVASAFGHGAMVASPDREPPALLPVSPVVEAPEVSPSETASPPSLLAEYIEKKDAFMKSHYEQGLEKIRARAKSREKYRNQHEVEVLKGEVRAKHKKGQAVSYRDFYERKDRHDVGVEPDRVDLANVRLDREIEELKIEKERLSEEDFIKKIEEYLSFYFQVPASSRPTIDLTCTSPFDFLASQEEVRRGTANEICVSCGSVKDKALMLLEGAAPELLPRVQTQKSGLHVRLIFQLKDGRRVAIDPFFPSLVITPENKAGTYIYSPQRDIAEYAGLPVSPLKVEPGEYPTERKLFYIKDDSRLLGAQTNTDRKPLRIDTNDPEGFITGWRDTVQKLTREFEAKKENAAKTNVPDVSPRFSEINVWRLPDTKDVLEVAPSQEWTLLRAQDKYREALGQFAHRHKVITLDATTFPNPSVEVLTALNGGVIDPKVKIETREQIDNLLLGDLDGADDASIEAITHLNNFKTITIPFDAKHLPLKLLRYTDKAIEKDWRKRDMLKRTDADPAAIARYVFRYHNAYATLNHEDVLTLRNFMEETRFYRRVYLHFDKKVTLSPEHLALFLNPKYCKDDVMYVDGSRANKKHVFLANIALAIPAEEPARTETVRKYQAVLNDFWRGANIDVWRAVTFDDESYFEIVTQAPEFYSSELGSKTFGMLSAAGDNINYDLNNSWENQYVGGFSFENQRKIIEMLYRIYEKTRNSQVAPRIRESIFAYVVQMKDYIYTFLPTVLRKDTYHKMKNNKALLNERLDQLEQEKKRFRALCELVGYPL